MIRPTTISTIASRVAFVDNVGGNQIDNITINTVFYFFIDYEHIGFVVYKAKLSDIHIFIGDCEGLDEYYLVTEDFMELYSITDHDDLLYIDVRKNEMRIDNKPG